MQYTYMVDVDMKYSLQLLHIRAEYIEHGR